MALEASASAASALVAARDRCDQLLQGIPTKPGYDRDEAWSPRDTAWAMSEENVDVVRRG